MIFERSMRLLIHPIFYLLQDGCKLFHVIYHLEVFVCGFVTFKDVT